MLRAATSSKVCLLDCSCPVPPLPTAPPACCPLCLFCGEMTIFFTQLTLKPERLDLGQFALAKRHPLLN